MKAALTKIAENRIPVIDIDYLSMPAPVLIDYVV
jgi:hypothetical protein